MRLSTGIALMIGGFAGALVAGLIALPVWVTLIGVAMMLGPPILASRPEAQLLRRRRGRNWDHELAEAHRRGARGLPGRKRVRPDDRSLSELSKDSAWRWAQEGVAEGMPGRVVELRAAFYKGELSQADFELAMEDDDNTLGIWPKPLPKGTVPPEAFSKRGLPGQAVDPYDVRELQPQDVIVRRSPRGAIFHEHSDGRVVRVSDGATFRKQGDGTMLRLTAEQEKQVAAGAMPVFTKGVGWQLEGEATKSDSITHHAAKARDEFEMDMSGYGVHRTLYVDMRDGALFYPTQVPPSGYLRHYEDGRKPVFCKTWKQALRDARTSAEPKAKQALATRRRNAEPPCDNCETFQTMGGGPKQYVCSGDCESAPFGGDSIAREHQAVDSPGGEMVLPYGFDPVGGLPPQGQRGGCQHVFPGTNLDHRCMRCGLTVREHDAQRGLVWHDERY